MLSSSFMAPISPNEQVALLLFLTAWFFDRSGLTYFFEEKTEKKKGEARLDRDLLVRCRGKGSEGTPFFLC